MDTRRHRATLLPNRLEAVAGARNAPYDVLRLCTSERDAMKVSLLLGRVTQTEVALRCGVSKQTVSKWFSAGGVPGNRVRAFCNATTSNLLAQYHGMHRAMREASGVRLERDRLADIAQLAEAA